MGSTFLYHCFCYSCSQMQNVLGCNKTSLVLKSHSTNTLQQSHLCFVNEVWAFTSFSSFSYLSLFHSFPYQSMPFSVHWSFSPDRVMRIKLCSYIWLLLLPFILRLQGFSFCSVITINPPRPPCGLMNPFTGQTQTVYTHCVIRSLLIILVP